MGNIAYIDNQNLFMSTKYAPNPWRIDMRRFRIYLSEKYKVEKAYLFMGAYDYSLQSLYESFQGFGYVLVWRPHGLELRGEKKTNVDTDIVFYMLRDYIDDDSYEKAILVSGDGDFIRTATYLLEKGKLERVLLPARHNASSLYKELPEANKALLDIENVKKRIGR